MRGELPAFFALSAVVICTPGPDTALTVRNAIVGGRAGGVWTAAGVAAGQAVWTVAAALGVATLLHASAPAFTAVKIAGAAYLIYLGVQSLRAALTRPADVPGNAGPAPRVAPVRAFRQGLLNNLGNPKMAAFFTSLLPQVIPPGHGGETAFAVLLALGLVFCALTFTWLAAYSVVVGRARRLLARPRLRRGMDGVAGCVLIGFGVRLAAADPG
jgi:RhtB (resistance to homoserine/threonine) family protein